MRRLITLALLLAAAHASQPAYAQNQNPSGGQPAAQPSAQRLWLSVTEVSVKPEMMTEFQRFMTSETNPALRKGGVKWRDVWQRTDAAGDPFEFVIVMPVENMATFDGGGALEKGLGKEGAAAWREKAGRYVNSVRRHVIRTRPDLSHQGKRTGPPKLAVVSAISVAPGRNQEWAAFTMNDYMPVFRQAGATYLVAETTFGDNVNEFVTLTLRDSFADIDKGPLPVQALGVEGARKLNQKLPAGVVTHIKRSFLRYVPELSIMAAEMADK